MENISINDFDEQVGRLVGWFKAKINQAHTKTMYKKLHSWPRAALQDSVDILIETRRPMPGNFPTIIEIRDLMSTWLSNHPREMFARMAFDPVEDLRYPIDNLVVAMNILANRGKAPFENYCRQYRMPQKDQERVINKVRAAWPESKVSGFIEGVSQT
jgi:hypothetical protein